MNFITQILTILILFSYNDVIGQDNRLFPNYDEIVHYYIDFNSENYWSFSNEQLDSIFQDHGGDYVLQGLTDKIPEKIETDLKKNHFQKSVLNKYQCTLVDSVFIQKIDPIPTLLTVHSEAYFSDYFLFKKDGKIVGVIQIAYNNSDYVLLGNVLEPKFFGNAFEIGKFLDAYYKSK